MVKKFRLKKGDSVRVISGKYKGKIGTITKIVTSSSRAIVSGINVAKVHTKPNAQSSGGIVSKEMSIHISNLAYYLQASSITSKILYVKLDNTKKVRVLKKTNETIS